VLAQRRSGPNHEQVSPIHPVCFVTNPSAGHDERRDPLDAQEHDVTGPLLIEHDDEGIRAFLEKRKPVYIKR
jgi:hypothetical protein